MLSVLTFNIMFNKPLFWERFEELLNTLETLDFDVICLQEVLSILLPLLQKRLTNYNLANTNLIPEKSYGELILVRKEIELISVFYTPLQSIMGRILLQTKIKKNQSEYNICTFHFESYVGPTYPAAQVRQSQIKEMWKSIHDNGSFIFCGDTNMNDYEECKLPLNIIDSWVQAGKPNFGKYTYFANRFWNYNGQKRFDKIFYTNNLNLIGFGILGNDPIVKNKWLSDHNGVYVYLL
jgi:endonuclease/exonuclease/phosphatase family metal-dependent hydrolase